MRFKNRDKTVFENVTEDKIKTILDNLSKSRVKLVFAKCQKSDKLTNLSKF